MRRNGGNNFNLKDGTTYAQIEDFYDEWLCGMTFVARDTDSYLYFPDDFNIDIYPDKGIAVVTYDAVRVDFNGNGDVPDIKDWRVYFTIRNGRDMQRYIDEMGIEELPYEEWFDEIQEKLEDEDISDRTLNGFMQKLYRKVDVL